MQKCRAVRADDRYIVHKSLTEPRAAPCSQLIKILVKILIKMLLGKKSYFGIFYHPASAHSLESKPQEGAFRCLVYVAGKPSATNCYQLRARPQCGIPKCAHSTEPRWSPSQGHLFGMGNPGAGPRWLAKARYESTFQHWKTAAAATSVRH